MRYARTAPSTMPITVAPTMPIAETWIVRQSPSERRLRLSQIEAQSKLASRVMRSTQGRRAPRAAPLNAMCLAALRRGILADRVLELRALPRHVAEERGPIAFRRVGLEDRRELVAILHGLDRGVHPLAHRRVALADADTPRNVEELVVRQLQCRVLSRDPEDER